MLRDGLEHEDHLLQAPVREPPGIAVLLGIAAQE